MPSVTGRRPRPRDRRRGERHDHWHRVVEPSSRLLAASGRGPEAARVFDRSHDRRVPFVLEGARLAERLGDRPTAVKYYEFVAQAWLHADPELQPVVAEARAAIVRLGGEPQR